MRFSTSLFTALTASAAYVVAVPVSSGVGGISSTPSGDFEVKHLFTYQPSGSDPKDKNITVAFTFIDHKARLTTTCGGSWQLNVSHPATGYPSGGYTSCANNTVGWNFADGSYTNITNFQLQLERFIGDDMIEFAHSNVTKENLGCLKTQEGVLECKQLAKPLIKPEIYALVS